MKHLPSILVLIATGVGAFAADAPLSLAGQWRFQLDRQDTGATERWYARTLPDTVKLPGGLTEQGIGDPVTMDTKWTGGIVDRSWFTAPEFAEYRQPGNIKVPFWLQPELYYAGAAWFQRDIEIPPDWQGKRVVLFLERPHWETRVWVDNQAFGTNNALGTPHEYILGQLPPGKHRLTIRVDNRMVVDVGENSHCVSDHTQGNWNGIVGRIELRPTPLVWIEEVQVYPHLATQILTVKGRLGNATGKAGEGTIHMSVGVLIFAAQQMSVSWTPDGGRFEADIPLKALPPWDEFSPVHQPLDVSLHVRGQRADSRTIEVGMREVSAEGTQLTINGRKTFIRGTLECAIFPKTGHPPTDVEEWMRIIRVAKSYGLNLLRFHSYCPPEAAFQAADCLGMYLQVETCWANGGPANLGDGRPVDQWIYDETDRILKYYGNHPSFLLMPYGNEPGGRNANAYLAKYVEHFKAKDPRRLWSSGSGWPQLPENQFHVTPDPRIQAWGEGLKSRINARPPETTTDYRDYIVKRSVPVISHEIGQWCVYPNFGEIPKYTGYLKPKNFDIFRDRLEANGMGKLAKQFLLASGKLQTLCYKEDIESALRTPGMGGFQLLDLHDFPGQGTALVGVLDPFWEEKGYVTAAEYSRFCNNVVPLARLAKRVFTVGEILSAELEAANCGPTPLTNITPRARILGDDGKVHLDVRLTPQDVPIGNGVRLAPLNFDLRGLPAPARYKLVVSLASDAKGIQTPENDWDIWVYPAKSAAEPAKDILVTARFDEAARARLRAGGKVLLTIPGKQVRNFDTAPVKLGFSSIFWNTAWTGRQAPTTLGILCDPEHPALAHFPTDFHSNWQWWYLIHRAGALRLDLLPREVQPIVRVIDDWVTARPLGLVIEGKVGSGKLLICGFDLTQDTEDPVSRQMRTSLLRYLGSTECKPAVQFLPEQVQSLCVERQPGGLSGIRSLQADSEQAEYEVANAVDGEEGSIWHTAWGDSAPGFPHELVVEFETPRLIAGIAARPRQDGNRNGWIKAYEVLVSADGLNWGTPLAQGEFPADASPKLVKFSAVVRVRFLKLRALSGHASGPWASLAELNVLPAEAK